MASKKFDVVKALNAVKAIAEKLKATPGERSVFSKNPVAYLQKYGIDRKLAVNIIATEVGAKVSAGDCNITSCGCTNCTSCRSYIDMRVLPALKDQKAWSKLFAGR